MNDQRKQKLLGPLPRGKCVAMRRNQPIMIDKAVAAWRRANRRRRKRELMRARKILQQQEALEVKRGTAEIRILNPFAPDED